MKYFVEMNAIDDVSLPPQQVVGQIEHMVLPSLQQLKNLEAEHKILAGGVFAGQRGGAMVLDVASNEELSRILQSLPMWGLCTTRVVPMQSFSDRLQQDSKAVEQLKETF